MNRIEVFETHRERLQGIAYRMLGSAAEAEDVVQDAWLRWQAAEGTAIESVQAWLCTVVVRLSLDRLKSARHEREQYVGPWLPEPVLTQQGPDPESISMALLVVLERLSPLERAAYLLHEVFEYGHAEVARMLDREEAACRQLCHRARARVKEGRPRFAPSHAEHQRLLGLFSAAMLSGDLQALERTLAVDAALLTDSGGKFTGAARRPVRGAHSIALFFVGVVRKFPPGPDQTFEVVEVNGWPALVGRKAGVANVALSIETDGRFIVAIHNVLNPEKLRRV